MITEAEIQKALQDVKDPELGYNIVALGLIYESSSDENGNIKILYTLTSPACPEGATIEKNIRDRIRLINGVKDVKTELTFSPAWSADKMSPELRTEFGLMGI